MHLTHRQTCRVCGSHSLTKVVSLGPQYLQGSFVKPGKELPSQRRIPTSLVRCDPYVDERACGLLQMEFTVPPAILYSAYWYRSGTNKTMTDHLSEIANESKDIIGKPNLCVLDIGCNDGTLLNAYPNTFDRYGIDPSDLGSEISPNITLIKDFFPSAKLDTLLGGKKFDIITSIAMFYDLEDPVGFAKSIRTSLAPNGIWCFEMSYMPSMLATNSYDTICHEHLEYYSLAVIEFILRKSGMKLVKASLNSSNGGSLRCHATPVDNFEIAESLVEINSLRQSEFDLALDTDIPYQKFEANIKTHKIELMNLLTGLRAEGKHIHLYGASTKGNTLLQWCGIDHHIIDMAADRNPDKNGARTLGTNIPIVSEEISRAVRPDYYLVLPWHFRKEFIEREHELLQSGTKFIFPLPTIEIV